MKIEGAGVLVTGASRGIGEATAIELAARGARVTIAARSQPDLDRVATAISAAGGTCVAVIPTDVSDEAQVESMVRTADEALGGVDILVNNAGLGLNGPVADIDPADLHYVFQVNLFAPHVATRAALPGMLRRRRGHIVNVGSVASHIATPGLGGYSSTKFALKALSDVLRAELQGTGVHVSLICPGPIATHFVKGARGDRGGLPQKPVGAPGLGRRQVHRAGDQPQHRRGLCARLLPGPGRRKLGGAPGDAGGRQARHGAGQQVRGAVSLGGSSR